MHITELHSGTLLDILDRPIAFQRVFVKVTGSITGALLLSQAVYWQKRTKGEDGWWWKTQEEWEAETGMTRRELEGARKDCIEAGILEYQRKGLPAKGFYRVNVAALHEALSGCGSQSRLAESANQGELLEPNQIGENRQSTSTETTAETTAERKLDGPVIVATVSNPAHEAVALWIQAYNDAYPATPYRNTLAKRRRADEQAAGSLLKSGMTAKQVGDLAKRMFATVKQAVNGRAAWWATRCRTVEHFALHVNEIEGELNGLAQNQRSGGSRGSRTAGTANDTPDNPYAGL